MLAFLLFFLQYETLMLFSVFCCRSCKNKVSEVTLLITVIINVILVFNFRIYTPGM